MSAGISRCTGPGGVPVAIRIAARSIAAARSGEDTVLFQRVTPACSGSPSSSWYSKRSRELIAIDEVSEITGLDAHSASASAPATLETPGPRWP